MRYPFIDPVSGRQVWVLTGSDGAGVQHPDCDFRAEVFPELDSFFCRECTWNGRISGAWFIELLDLRWLGDDGAVG